MNHGTTLSSQLELEATQVTRGVERYHEALTRAQGRDRDLDGGPVSALLRDMMSAMIPQIEALQKEAHAKVKKAITRGVRMGGWELAIDALDADVLAYITCRTVVSLVDRQNGDRRIAERHAMARRIGTAINYQFRWDKAVRAERSRLKGDEADPPYNRINKLRGTVKEINPRFVRRWLKRVDDLETIGLEGRYIVLTGMMLMDTMAEKCSQFIAVEKVTTRTQNGQVRRAYNIHFTEETAARLDAAHVRRSRALPWLLPMISEPLDWKYDDDEEKYVGGYYQTREPLIKQTIQAHTSALLVGDVVPEVNLRALNTIQRTPWMVDAGMLEFAVQAVEEGRGELLPVAPEQELPASIDAEVWARMTKTQQEEHAVTRRMIHDGNNKLRAKREAMKRQLVMADEFAQYERIYFPHNLDFRGRVYPLPQDLNPQSDDFGRGLLTFAEGKPLGHRGFMWLCFHVANTYGLDKEDRDAQYEWVCAHSTQIAYIARDPFAPEVYDMVTAAEEPWQFIAACREWDAAVSTGDPYSYESRLPIQVDGSCNGLQHLSAMGLDPVGAEATNLMPGDRQDIYQVVADKVSKQTKKDMHQTAYSGGNPQPSASAWRGHVTRKTVKRGVMTMPYGLTAVGMRDQLIQDGHCAGLEGNMVENATYLRDLMQDAIGDTVVAAADIMEWMQFNAKQLASINAACEWTTPTGFRVRQAYYQTTARYVRTVVGRAVVYEADGEAPLRASKQTTSIAPNIIHSFDAAHMNLTIAALDGLSFSVIHDSFGTHAADMDDLNRTLREQFVEMYETDWFTSIQGEFEAMAGEQVELAPPPSKGDFDLSQVLQSNFFFA